MKRWLIDILANAPGISGYSLYGVVRHPIKAFFIYPYLEVKWFIQRGRRGYSDRDSWNLGYYLAQWMPEAVRSLKAGHGVPARFVDVDEPTEMDMVRYRAQWDVTLETIAKGFEATRLIDEELPMPGTVRYYELELMRMKGMLAFIEWHQSLWD